MNSPALSIVLLSGGGVEPSQMQSGHIVSDEELLLLHAKGSPDAFSELFRRYRSLAFRVAYRLLNHEADALDAMQEGFVNALRNIHQFRGQSSFKNWLLRVVSNAALDLGRQRRRRQNHLVPASPDFDHPAQEVAPTTLLEHHDLVSRLAHALEQLPEAQRETFVLHVDGGLSYREVAEALGISAGTVMSRLFYARQRLKEFLTDQVLT